MVLTLLWEFWIYLRQYSHRPTRTSGSNHCQSQGAGWRREASPQSRRHRSLTSPSRKCRRLLRIESEDLEHCEKAPVLVSVHLEIKIMTHQIEKNINDWFNYLFSDVLNPFGKSDQLIVLLDFAKIAERCEAKSAKRCFASKYFGFLIFDAMCRFVLLASLCSAIFSEF